jgi:hypothetical protein
MTDNQQPAEVLYRKCPDCDRGIIIAHRPVPVCCGVGLSSGECCGIPNTEYEQQQEQCGRCQATGFEPLPSQGEVGVWVASVRNNLHRPLCHSLVLSEPMQQEKAWVKAVEPHFPDTKGFYICLVDIGDCLIEKDCYWNGSTLWNGDLSEVDEIIAWRREEKEPKPSSCSHPRNERTYIGEGYLRCNLCGEEFK